MSIETMSIGDARPAIGSCTFLLAGHGDLRIEWEEKDHAEIVKFIHRKLAEGMRFFAFDATSGRRVPIRRRSPIRHEVIVRDADIKKLFEAGVARFPTTRFEGFGPLMRLCRLDDLNEATRSHTIAIPSPQSVQSMLVGDQAIADFLNSPDIQALHHHGQISAKRVGTWIYRGALPVHSSHHQRHRVARQVLEDWFIDQAKGVDELSRLSPSLRDEIARKRRRKLEERQTQKIREAKADDNQ